MGSFLEKLRTSSVFGNAFSPHETNPLLMLDQFKRMNPEPPPMIQQIGQEMVDEPQRPMNTVFRDALDPYQEAKIALARDQIGSREKIEAGKQDIDKQKLGISQQRADVYEFSKRNPQLKFVQNKLTGELEAVNPLNGQTVKSFGQTQMGQEDLINLNQEKAIDRIEATGGEQRKTEEVRQKGRESLEEIKARHTRELREAEANIPSKATGLPTQQSKQFQVNYNKLINAKPAYRKFVKLDDNGMPIITPPGSTTFASSSPTQEQYDEMNQYIFGKAPEEKKYDSPPLVSSHGSTSDKKTEAKSTPKADNSKKTETPEERMARLKRQAGVR